MVRVFFIVFWALTSHVGIASGAASHAARLDSVFTRMELMGVDVEKPQLFGFFFCSNDERELSRFLVTSLEDQGYRVRGITEYEEKAYLLHVDNVEVLTSMQLASKCADFEELVQNNEKVSFDGWDVSNEDESMPLVSPGRFVDSLVYKTPEELEILFGQLRDYGLFDYLSLASNWCVDNDVNKSAGLYQRGLLRYDQGDIGAGLNDLRNAHTLDPLHYKTCFNLGVMLYEIEEYEEAAFWYQKAVKIDNKSSRSFYGLGSSQYMRGEFNLARKNCAEALRLDRNNASALVLKRLLDD